ncbi:hypothetical protein F4779DRAFT_569014 [Xylariaceae sp. FL0662B]|nr:hypothetical protein F4779DRAFT_569014 [Xylariaceae sp. FL0662B]
MHLNKELPPPGPSSPSYPNLTIPPLRPKRRIPSPDLRPRSPPPRPRRQTPPPAPSPLPVHSPYASLQLRQSQAHLLQSPRIRHTNSRSGERTDTPTHQAAYWAPRQQQLQSKQPGAVEAMSMQRHPQEGLAGGREESYDADASCFMCCDEGGCCYHEMIYCSGYWSGDNCCSFWWGKMRCFGL